MPAAGSFDHLYDGAETFGQVYAEIVESLVSAAAQAGRVLYAVPGSPAVLERSVEFTVTRRPDLVKKNWNRYSEEVRKIARRFEPDLVSEIESD